MSNKTVLSSINVEDHQYFMLTITKDEGNDGFDLKVWDGRDCWCGSVEVNDLESTSRRAKMSFDEVLRQTKAALTDPSSGNYIYTFTTKGSTMTFVWKKHLAAEDVKFQLGSTGLKKSADSNKVLSKILQHSGDHTAELLSTITSLEATNQRLSTERASALKRLEKCVTAKEALEFDLYSKFAVVLNDKKAKIRGLVQQIEDLKSGKEQTSRNNIGKHSRSDRVEDMLDEKDDTDTEMAIQAHDVNSDQDTDDEMNSPPSKKMRGARPVLTGESPMLEEEDSITHIGGGRRRQRRPAAGKKQTPSKPVIPKVSSGETPSTSKARGRSLRKSASKSSSENLDADDLYGEI